MPKKKSKRRPTPFTVDGYTVYSGVDAATILGVGPRRLRQFVDEGRLSYIELPGGRRCYAHEDLMEFKSQPRPSGAASPLWRKR